ncbi:precorrin-6y C5,15-methyltransferase (decarboxylating) subunit CbiE [Streptomyces sp. WI04-05B]|uniref:precorrin-6y C5,15-methyltransferase (decarboxylating) subunit CbiE n=1 Tax=Streptomyces TaxID=1883 RepID=UPI0029A891BD|nr:MULTISPECIES: precorrin-6y C5,15-methyltransferase (decarboxylating) subunit CbiE [unclassified Streptomyces]MDX2541076.1 precorrin-6y C5,15-methyltransferase (decarboxylating) subunit CbiE [Streptomyces sp. WI04-05B]MDX2585694.1 precorrin-6y C5,15-methyltransferase (decarboxylating) subunit CbiE [Streptomyces sp. WI04-05A]MDX3752207.1 precorrin-6y C5,15-methyltransferase (decarboxylating) subunit CbiE [Streptomyces sp. AK08-02]
MITVIGTGTGAPLPPDATAAVAGAALVVGGRRHLAAVAATVSEGAERVALGALAPALDAIEEYVGKERPVVVLASGDPGFFGIVRALAERFGAGRLDVRPGVSSVATAFARTGLTWDDAVVVSAHGRALRTAVNVCRARPKVAVLTGPGAGPAELGAALAGGPGDGPGARVLVVASALGDPELERVERVTPAEAARRDWGDAVSVVLCLDEARALATVPVTVAGEFAGPARWALDEREFAHRDSMITKFEVRALALARLGPRLGDLVWDIGAGSGSVAVECARLGAAVVAVEKTPDGAERVRANAAAHGVEVRVVEGSAPERLPASTGGLGGLDGLDEPDAVFIGGGGRELPAIVAACAVRARRTVVVALAALDRVPAVRAALVDAGLDCDGVLLQSSRLAPLPGEVSRLAATNPVFLLWGTRPSARTDRRTGNEGVTL